MPNGTILHLYAPSSVPSYGFNDGLVFGFRVDDIDAASRDLEASGCQLLGEITRIPEMQYAYRHFTGPDARLRHQRAALTNRPEAVCHRAHLRASLLPRSAVQVPRP